MFIFLVIMPERTLKAKCPLNYVVVTNIEHQIPLGTLLFSSVDTTVAMQSVKLKQKLITLSQDAEEKLLKSEETKVKATIMQHLMCQRLYEASELYLKNKSILSDLSNREIAWYVNPFVKDDPVRYAAFFPDLPPPLHSNELRDAEVTSVEMSISSESRAKRILERTHTLAEKKKQRELEESKEDTTQNGDGHGKESRDEQEERSEMPSVSIVSAILEHITHDRMDVASEMYTRKLHQLDGFAKREISQCVWRNTNDDDKEMVGFYFPELPGSS